ncbi:MAG: hypothetical protein U0264_13410 [Candidatus Kapaibacterium sp.]
MNTNEYIEFTISQKKNFEELERIFYQIKNTHNNSEDYEIESFKALIPEYVFNFFSKENNPQGWSLENIIRFLIEDLDVTYLDISEIHNNIGRLNFDPNGYPYGGPDSLIQFLKAYDMTPYEVYEGLDTYVISWVSNIEFKFELKVPQI